MSTPISTTVFLLQIADLASISKVNKVPTSISCKLPITYKKARNFEVSESQIKLIARGKVGTHPSSFSSRYSISNTIRV
ncbi:uncharacterized protein N7487_011238 [Penicillium crustosum]|uniref:uncharacterized protein n=1 Tax=Penicillium crustosum TaxID=36656 RepID=UPI00239FA0B7|nr:uncharacterized protein N7487_011238 [Penicillium crustosum]KAJ5393597.1 hypothetical protein N7487_011238 [Penicillium crustosum]